MFLVCSFVLIIEKVHLFYGSAWSWRADSMGRGICYNLSVRSQLNILLCKALLYWGAFCVFIAMDELPDNQRYKTLINGAVYDNSLKRIVSGAALTSDGARALVEKRVQRRREIVKESANKHVKAGEFAAVGDLAFLAAIVSAAMSKATNPADPKAIEAGRFVIEYAGEAESAVGPGGESSVHELRGLVREIAEAARALAAGSITESGPEIIDAEST